MKILFVVNNCYVRGNGLSASAQRTISYLKEAGMDVRVLSGVEPTVEEVPEYQLKPWKFPIFDGLIHRQGYSFFASDYDVFKEAVEWADIVHLEEPFQLERNVASFVRKVGKPMTATYHLHTQNLFHSIHLTWDKLINALCMILWRNGAYNKCDMLQVPTENAKQNMIRWHFKPEIRVISNGMIPHEGIDSNSPICASDNPDGSFTIVTTGRYSVEKDQITLLKAMKYSKYAQRIRLVLAGRGPIEDTLKKKADSMLKKGFIKYPVEFGFHNLEELEAIYRKSDLYVHCSTIEVEGLSCMEAIELGLVPVIATGKLTATAQYALSDKSKFKARNARELAERIDWWLEHDRERRAEARKYLGMGKEYDIHKSIEKLIEMYEDVLDRHRKTK